MTKKDPLKNIMGNVNKQIPNTDAPFQKRKERTKSVQVRESIFKAVKLRAFKENVTMADLTTKALKYAIKHKII